MADAVYTRSRAKDSENSVAQNGSGGISGQGLYILLFFSFPSFWKNCSFHETMEQTLTFLFTLTRANFEIIPHPLR